MDELIDAIRVAVAESATAEQKAAGAQACRTLLTALDAEPGRPIALIGGPAPSPLAQLQPEQAFDLLIAKLRSLVPTDPEPATPTEAARGVRIAFVQPPPRPPRAR